MFDEYFTYWDDLPADSGFSLYSATHIAWLTVIFVCVCFGTFIYIRKTENVRRRIRYVLAGVLTAMELYKDTVLTVTGHMELQYLPLQLCGLAIIVEVCYLLVANATGMEAFRIFLGEVMCVICMPGALAALLFPDWTRYPVINFMSLHSFIIHGLLVLVPFAVMAGREHTVSIRRCFMPAGYLICVSFLVNIVNIAADCNFMFLRHPSHNSPFEAVYLNYGYGCYMLVYALVVVLVIAIIYGAAALILRLLLDENCAIK